MDEVIRLNSTDADVYHWRGEAKYYLERTVEAIDDYNKAIELKDNNMNYYKSRGYARIDIDQYDKAKDDLEKALELAELANDTFFFMENIPLILREIDFSIAEDDRRDLRKV